MADYSELASREKFFWENVMIEIFEGKIGGGKTYTAVERILEHIGAGGTVYTNVELHPEGIARYLRRRWGVIFEPDQYVSLEPEQIPKFCDHIEWGTIDLPTLVVIDEAHIFFNSRAWKDASRELLTFLTQSRKACVDIIFIAQSWETIDKQLRVQCQFVWRFRDMNRLSLPILGKWPLQQIMEVQLDYDGKTKLRWRLKMKDKMVFGAYQTLAFLDREHQASLKKRRDMAKKRRTLERVPAWKRAVRPILWWAR